MCLIWHPIPSVSKDDRQSFWPWSPGSLLDSADLCRILTLKVLRILLSPELTLLQESDVPLKEFTGPKPHFYWALITKVHSSIYLGKKLNTLKDTSVIFSCSIRESPQHMLLMHDGINFCLGSNCSYLSVKDCHYDSFLSILTVFFLLCMTIASELPGLTFLLCANN